jgi:hypothetical protein
MHRDKQFRCNGIKIFTPGHFFQDFHFPHGQIFFAVVFQRLKIIIGIQGIERRPLVLLINEIL